MANMAARIEEQRGDSVIGSSQLNPSCDNGIFAGVPNLRTGFTVDDIAHPAYMVSYNFELTWYNEPARERILGFEALPPGTESRNIFQLLPQAADRISLQRRNTLLHLYASLGRQHVSKASLLGIVKTLDCDVSGLIDELYESSDRKTRKIIVDLPCVFAGENGAAEVWRVYGIYFREGILIIHVPSEEVDPSLLEIVSRRDDVVRNLMSKQLPAFTQLMMLEADLTDSAKIRAELPPDEYFQLIEEIWSTMAPIYRKYHGTYGRYCGDGVRYYFLPRLDGNYVSNGETCARELAQEMRKISARWQLRKNWFNELGLNVRLQKGQEWLGILQSDANVGPVVRGDNFNHATGVVDVTRIDPFRAVNVRGGKQSPTDGAYLSMTPHGAAPATEEPAFWRRQYNPVRPSIRVRNSANRVVLQTC